ncbi:MAG: polyprenyl synthetase family protein [bacterium]|nr:polyprenyl synthetase family protein [bacterium]
MDELVEIYEPIKDKLKETEECIQQSIISECEDVTSACKHIINAGGKRIRPALVLLSAKVCGYKGKRDIDLATAAELIHTATLIHDDVIDEASLRRGKQTLNLKFGNRRAILTGDFLYTKAISIILQDQSIEIMKTIFSAISKICEGEIEQTLRNNSREIREEGYIEMIKNKTASFFSCCCELGAMLGNLKNQEVSVLKTFGMNLGLAFQIVDDILDVVSTNGGFGNFTLPIIYGLRQASLNERKRILKILDKGSNEEDMKWLVNILKNYQAIEYAKTVAKGYIDQAKDNLKTLPNCTSKDSLIKLSDFVIKRRI